MTWEQVFVVVRIWEWPSRAMTTWGCTPALMSRVAEVRLASCKRMMRTSARVQCAPG